MSADQLPPNVFARPEAIDQPSLDEGSVRQPLRSATPKGVRGALLGTDIVLAVMLVLFAFLLASFAVRNSDFWMHLATGRLTAQGQYAFGSDPFRHTSTPGDVWVNHSWLYDRVLYAVVAAGGGPEGFGGSLAVILKSILAGGLAAVLLLTRKPAQPLWPGVLVGMLALLAVAPRLILQPAALSWLFLALTMWLLMCRPRRPAWLAPVLFGGLMLLWVNCDAWFVLGPLAVLLFLAGETLDGVMNPTGKSETDGDEGVTAEPAGVPAWKTLGLVLAVGVVATILNPFHIQAWALPTDLWPSSELKSLRNDPQFEASFMATASTQFWGDWRFGNNLNGWCYVALLVLTPLAFVLNFRAIRFSHLLTWFGFAALSLLHFRLVPIFAVVAAPILAWNLSEGLVALRRLFTKDEPTLGLTSALTFAHFLGRFFTVAGLGLLGYAAWYGLVTQPVSGELYETRSFCLGVYADPAWAQAGKRFQSWRESGELPADARGFNYTPDMGAYLAWYAPAEKAFFDNRLGLSREAQAYFNIRQAINFLGTPEARPEHLENLATLMRDAGVSYITLYEGVRPRSGVVPILWANGELTPPNVVLAPDEARSSRFRLWYLDGRTTVFGLRPPAPREEVTLADKLRLDLVKQAFGPQPPEAETVPGQIPAFPTDKALTERTFWQSISTPASPPPAAAGRVTLYRQIMDQEIDTAGYSGQVGWASSFLALRFAIQNQSAALMYPATLQEIPPRVRGVYSQSVLEERPITWALPVLMARSGRSAVRDAPTDAESYLALANAYSLPVASEPFSRLTRIAAFREAVRFTPDPELLRRSGAFDPLRVAHSQLSIAYIESSQADLALEVADKALRFYDFPPPNPTEQYAKSFMKDRQEIQDRQSKLKSFVETRTQDWTRLGDAAGRATPLDRIRQARERGLVKEAIKGLTELAAEPVPRLELTQVLVNAGEPRAALDVPASNKLLVEFTGGRLQAEWALGDTSATLASLEMLRKQVHNPQANTASDELIKFRAEATAALLHPSTPPHPLLWGFRANLVQQAAGVTRLQEFDANRRSWELAQLLFLSGLAALERGQTAEATEFFRQMPVGNEAEAPPEVLATRRQARRYLELLQKP